MSIDADKLSCEVIEARLSQPLAESGTGKFVQPAIDQETNSMRILHL